MAPDKKVEEWTIFNLAGAAISFLVFTVLAVTIFGAMLVLANNIAAIGDVAVDGNTLFLGVSLITSAVTIAAGLAKYKIQ